MATPKSRTSHTRTRQRKAHWLGSLKNPGTTVCPNCGETAQMHRVCPECGQYRGRQVVKQKAEGEGKSS
ncbi:MAG: 50S ribosomal protein L32 [Synergistetes bacterium ADurb.Bin155]|jgi:large subunit ribosomal protein L32|nr:50S ribosomal protein L32 [Synergistales bacterium]MBP8995377.1 50S ribosomal protein L32 [Synergistales bacterium]OQB47101.1 MAG: 50S ribosomal protein L32 [Synergistetes bacterium ADurb.Bin155]HOG14485.1 50S ribosomal protein L32 [Synergistales bacterium]HPK41860.1 50S ribosomal protein L32 [Synergistales bacterium]